jgi:hypothetical protein
MIARRRASRFARSHAGWDVRRRRSCGRSISMVSAAKRRADIGLYTGLAPTGATGTRNPGIGRIWPRLAARRARVVPRPASWPAVRSCVRPWKGCCASRAAHRGPRAARPHPGHGHHRRAPGRGRRRPCSWLCAPPSSAQLLGNRIQRMEYVHGQVARILVTKFRMSPNGVLDEFDTLVVRRTESCWRSHFHFPL